MILWFSGLWVGVKDNQQCSSSWHIPLQCSCRLPGTAIPAAFPPWGHAHHQRWVCQESGLLPTAIHLCQWCSFLLWAEPVLTAHSSYKRLDEELFIILNALVEGFLSTSLLCSEFWSLLRADRSCLCCEEVQERSRFSIHLFYRNWKHCFAEMALGIMGLVWGRAGEGGFC